MANSPQARKRAKQNDKRRLHNMGMRSRARTMLKKTLKLIETGEKDAAKAEYTNTVSAYDKLANKNLVSKNKAARVASRLNAKLKAAFAG